MGAKGLVGEEGEDDDGALSATEAVARHCAEGSILGCSARSGMRSATSQHAPGWVCTLSVGNHRTTFD